MKNPGSIPQIGLAESDVGQNLNYNVVDEKGDKGGKNYFGDTAEIALK